MKKLALTLTLLLFGLVAHGQQSALQTWNEEARTNIRLLPKYGYKEKSAAQKQADQEFIEEMMRNPEFEESRTTASAAMVDAGFDYLHRGDIRTAMYRFNQAYLLDSLHADIYLGYAKVYQKLGDRQSTMKYYEEYNACIRVENEKNKEDR